MRFPLPLASLALLAACHDAPPPPERIEGPIPAQICTEVGKSLATLSKEGGLDYKNNGEAMVEQAAWLQMTDDERDSIARALGFHAGCATGHQSENQEVVVRGEDGTVLMRRLVDTRTDPASLLGQKRGTP